jgi:hypothetical protein
MIFLMYAQNHLQAKLIFFLAPFARTRLPAAHVTLQDHPQLLEKLGVLACTTPKPRSTTDTPPILTTPPV